MDSLIGLKGKDFVILAADAVNAYSLLKLKNFDDKIWPLDDEKLMAIGGQHSDVLVFGDYIQKNLAFLKFKNGYKLSVEDTAQFVRSQLAQAIRKGPYTVSCLLAGFQENQPKLYWIDYLGSVIQISKATHGYAQYIATSILDTLQTSKLTLDQGLKVIDQCLVSLRDRCILTQTQFVIKVITKDGIRCIRDVKKPKGQL